MADDTPSTPAATENAAPSSPSPGQTAATPSPGETSAPSPSAKPTGETSAPSPSAPTEGDSRESLLEAVTKAVPELRTEQRKESDDAGGASPTPATPSEPTASQPDDYADLSDDPGADELAAYRIGGRRRVEKLLLQRREARAEADAAKAEIEQLKRHMPLAQAASSVKKYLVDNDIGEEDFKLTLELAAAMRQGNFKAFYEGVRPYMDLAEQYLGISLPPDLTQRVQQGHMTAQAAAMFQRERMDRALSESQRLRQAQVYDQATQNHTRQQVQTAVLQTVDSWERQTMQSDPDYARKKPLLEQVVMAVARERGDPQSPEHALGIAQEAYRRVNELTTQWVPPKTPTSRQPSSTGRTNGAAPAPKNLTEVVQQVIDRARA